MQVNSNLKLYQSTLYDDLNLGLFSNYLTISYTWDFSHLLFLLHYFFLSTHYFIYYLSYKNFINIVKCL